MADKELKLEKEFKKDYEFKDPWFIEDTIQRNQIAWINAPQINQWISIET